MIEAFCRRPVSPRRLAVAVLVLLTLAGARPAGAAPEPLAQAAKAYQEQRYAEAAASYRAAVDAGSRHPAVLYNLGNAYFRAGQLGPAILWYERALRLDPDFDDARYNLDVAREAVAARFGKDQVKGATAQPFWVNAVHWLPLEVLVVLVLALDLLFFTLLVALRFVPEGFTRTGLGVGAAFTFVAGALAGILLYGRIHYLERVRASIIVADEVVMRELPDATSREMPKLHAGHQVVVLRESQGFARVRLANRVEGWVPRDTVEPVALP